MSPGTRPVEDKFATPMQDIMDEMEAEVELEKEKKVLKSLNAIICIVVISIAAVLYTIYG